MKDICKCDNPKYNYPEMVWCDGCGKQIADSEPEFTVDLTTPETKPSTDKKKKCNCK